MKGTHVCDICGKEFIRENGLVNFVRNRGKKVCCSKKCQGTLPKKAARERNKQLKETNNNV